MACHHLSSMSRYGADENGIPGDGGGNASSSGDDRGRQDWYAGAVSVAEGYIEDGLQEAPNYEIF